MLGHMACRVLSASHDLTGTSRRGWAETDRLSHVLERDRCIEHCEARVADLHDAVSRAKPDVVINCIGLTTQKAAFADVACMIKTNAVLPHELARVCDEQGAKLVQTSTDCVFSGRRGAYTEDDTPDPVDLYGCSKLIGEVCHEPHLTLRTSLVGRQLAGNEGLLEWFISRRGQKVQGFTNVIFSGLTTNAFCRVLDRVLGAAPPLTGILHVASRPLSKFDLLQRVNAGLKLDIALEPAQSPAWDRTLDATRLLRTAGIAAPSWDEMLDEWLAAAKGYDDWRR
jgi:dTDP-4-dehydrorhamnose reductase